MADMSTSSLSTPRPTGWTATLPTVPEYNRVSNREYYPWVRDYVPEEVRVHEYNAGFLRVSQQTGGSDCCTPVSLPRTSPLSTPMEYLPLNFSLEIPTLTQVNVSYNYSQGEGHNQTSPEEAAGAIIRDVTLGVVLGLLCLLTFVGNAMVLHAVRTEKRLQTVSNMFIVSLAIADLIVGLCVMPISAIYIFTEEWLFGIVVCQFWIGVDYTASTASILNLFILSLDRYWSVTSPLKYLRKRTKKRAMIMISLVWTASSLWLIPIVGWHYFEHGGVRTVPSNVCDTEYANNIVLKIITGILNYYLPLAFMFILYSRIFMEIRKRSEFELGQRTSGGGSFKNTHKDVVRTSSMTDESNRSNENAEDEEEEEDQDTGTYASYNTNAPEKKSFLKNPPQFRVTEYETETGSEDEFAKLHRGDYTNLTLVRAAEQIRDTTTTTGTSCSSDVQTSDAEVRMEYMYDETVVDPTTERVHRFYDEHALLRGGANCHRPLTAETSLSSTTTPTNSRPGSSIVDDFTKIKISKVCNANGTRKAFLTARVTYKPKVKSGKHKRRRKGSTIPGLIQFKRMGRNNYDVESALKKQALKWKDRMAPTKPKKRPSAALAREIKAAKQLGVIMGAFTICFCPYFVLFMVVAFCDGCISMTAMTTVTWIGYLNSTFNPVLYPLCNTTFRRKFRSMLGLDKNDPKKPIVPRTYISNSRLQAHRPPSGEDYDSKITTY